MNATENRQEREPRQGSVFKRLSRLPRLIRESWRADLVALRNWWRRQRDVSVDYVVLPLSGSLPERSGPPRSLLQRLLPLPSQPLTIEALNERLQRIADAENVRGALIIMGDFTLTGLARLQNVRRSLVRLREAGKEVVVYSPYLDLAHYYVASAGNRLLAPPGAQFDVVGLHSEAIFLRDALEKIGIRAEVLQVSPYKTAGNMFAESQITPEQRLQMEWLVDDTYDAITADLAEARGMTQERIKALIDMAPFPLEQALDAGLLDGIAYEDQLPDLLAVEEAGTPSSDTAKDASGKKSAGGKGTTLLTWTKARPMLTERVKHPSSRYIGVVSLDGAIVMGSSRQPPVNLPIPLVGGAMAGEKTLVQLLRRAQNDDSMAALILHVESGGGSSLASELIWRQVGRVAAKKPVLAYLGDVAASGGYFVSAGAGYIMSQHSTLTGSIGVLMARMNLEGLLDKVAVNRAGINRGAHAGIYSEPRALHPEERALLWNLMQETYKQFKIVVSEGRGLDFETVEAVAGGRVWTGRQAKEHKLVDGHGDFVDAVNKAAELSDLPHGREHRIAVRNLFLRSEAYLPPQSNDVIQQIVETLTTRELRSLNGRTLALMPFELRLF